MRNGEPRLKIDRRIKKQENSTERQKNEWLESQSPQRRALIETVNTLVIQSPIEAENAETSDLEIGRLIQKRFQEALRNHYHSSGLADKVKALRLQNEIQPSAIPLDVQLCNLIAQESEGIHGWVDMLPTLKNMYPDAGMNCTMGSAMLHCALEDVGYTNIRTVLRAGHHVAMRELPDRKITLYDPTSLTTVNNSLSGYTRTFDVKQIENFQKIMENSDAEGVAFTLASDYKDSIGGFTNEDVSGNFRLNFYGYSTSIIMDIAIALENLSEIKDDIKHTETAEQIPFDIDGYKEALVHYLIAQNSTPLNNNAIQEIARSNRQPIEELLRAAYIAYTENGAIPEPYDYLSSPFLAKKDLNQSPPNPRDYKGSSDRYEQAKELVERFPCLRELDFKQIKEQFSLFDGYEFITKKIT